MKLRIYVFLWVGLCLALVYQYAIAHGIFSGPSLFFRVMPETRAGRPLSLVFGYAGFGLILLTNLYVIRKRLALLGRLGQPAGWLNFHIFCGLMGPTFIVFHSDFKVGGLVAISFWSMVIVSVSGVVGRYFYIQVLQKRADLERNSSALEQTLLQSIPASSWINFRSTALRRAGVIEAEPSGWGLLWVLPRSFFGDLRLAFALPGAGLPHHVRKELKMFAIARRRLFSFDTFQRYLGYWHSFHLPFAYIMYFLAAVHVTVALLFQV